LFCNYQSCFQAEKFGNSFVLEAFIFDQKVKDAITQAVSF